MRRSTEDATPGVVPLRTRDDLEALALRMLAATERHADDAASHVRLPGPTGGYGAAVDGLEGFARTFLIAGFVLAGREGDDPAGLLERFGRGLSAGTDPAGSHRWPRLEEHAQAKVEAASIALILDMTRPWLWEGLDSTVQRRVIDYLAAAVGDDTYPRINWVWFRLVVQTFLRSVGGPHSEAEMREDLATHDTFVRPGGWLSDGAERAFDHYSGWALHLYPALWSRMEGARDLAAGRAAQDRLLLDRFLTDALSLVGADGSPLIQGRSLIYRFAAAAPMWAGVLSEVPSHDAGTLRAAAMRIVQHFVDRGAPDEDGLLTLGWHGPWPALAQRYSGPGSPYWAAKGLLGLALPAHHEVWGAPAAQLPIDSGDVIRLAQAPGWIISGTSDDGIVRVVNHGTDHAVEGALTGDSPLYARLTYSTRTSPLLDEASWRSPLDGSVTLVDADEESTHRAGLTPLALEMDTDGIAAVGASRAQVHWITPDLIQQRHGSGLTGDAVVAASVTTLSLVRGAWEVRCVRMDHVTEAGRERAVTMRIGGWAVAAGVEHVNGGKASVAGDHGVSTVECAHPHAHAHVHHRRDATPLGDATDIPVIDIDVAHIVPGEWIAVTVGLVGGLAGVGQAPRVRLDGDVLAVVWADGQQSTLTLDHHISEEGAALSSETRVASDPTTTPTKEAQ
ncbi:DUF2264 domain-containing protein [Demequina muriae]|uniref:DUF2264 domain-containing protein n=1 Tax=Demequina muriae TaxID=3051664 RepID=A0ABT8GEK9_9MICO|nr:DUF2264 domain-containing protein [Demequina sp. EGI L300058]MDN4479872.1 DUF2264 domain-containing protein [Demequina sp. EGI L300058]